MKNKDLISNNYFIASLLKYKLASNSKAIQQETEMEIREK
jgi:hypothetical protein